MHEVCDLHSVSVLINILFVTTANISLFFYTDTLHWLYTGTFMTANVLCNEVLFACVHEWGCDCILCDNVDLLQIVQEIINRSINKKTNIKFNQDFQQDVYKRQV